MFGRTANKIDNERNAERTAIDSFPIGQIEKKKFFSPENENPPPGGGGLY